MTVSVFIHSTAFLPLRVSIYSSVLLDVCPFVRLTLYLFGRPTDCKHIHSSAIHFRFVYFRVSALYPPHATPAALSIGSIVDRFVDLLFVTIAIPKSVR